MSKHMQRPHPVPCVCGLCCAWVELVAEEANPGISVNANPAVKLDPKEEADGNDDE